MRKIHHQICRSNENNGGYCGYISDLDKGNARLYQGLYLTRGKHTINVDLKTSGVTARFLCRM